MHVIRLRKPWQRSVPPSSDAPQRVDAPDLDVVPAIPLGRCVQYVRSFNRPSGLQPDTGVQLVVASWHGRLDSVSINGVPLSIGDAPLRADIAGILQATNQIQIQLVANDSDPSPRLTGEVTLVIDP